MTLSIDVNDNTEKGTWEIKLIGEIDINNAQIFQGRLETALSGKRQDITLDLSDLEYIDSTGLGVIIGTYTSIDDEGLKIKIVNPKNNVKKLLNISGLDKIFC